jgi:hypothetical protein
VKDEAKVHEMIANACLRAHSPGELEAHLRAFLERHDLDPEDVAAILEAPSRLPLYRRLIRNNLEGVTFKMMPRTRARLNAVAAPHGGAAGAFDASFDAFLDEAAPRTPYLRDVPREFLEWVTPRWNARTDLPRYAADLASHELVEFAVSAAPVSPKSPPLDEVTLDRPLVFADAKRLMRYGYAVHTLPADLDDRTEPPHRATALLAYRDADHIVRFLDLSPLAASIVERLMNGESLAQALPPSCAEHGTGLSETLLTEVAALLADLGERGVLLGAKGNE